MKDIYNIGPYLRSLAIGSDIMSGNPHLLQGELGKKYSDFESKEENYSAQIKWISPDERHEMFLELKKIRESFKESLELAMSEYLHPSKNIYTNMAKKKSEKSSETPNVVEKATQKTENPQESMKSPEKEENKDKRAPQMVTVNGDRVTHGHVFKSNQSDDWYFTAKINDVPLKPQKVSKEDMEGLMNRTKNVAELMQTYYPTKLMPKVSAEDMRLPVSINTAQGEQRLYKFNVYMETHMDNVDYGKYRFYAQVDDQKMSASASRQDLNAYFDKVMKPADMVAKVFGDRLGMTEHYSQFQLPEGANIEAKDIRIMKNQQTNKYEIHANLHEHGKTSPKELSYDDKQSYFNKTATKEQLAAKYLGNEISAAFKNAPKHEQAVQRTLGI